MIIDNFPWCARCGPDTPHPSDSLEFHAFTNAPIEDTDGTVWTHWALCPITGEPVLLKVTGAENSA